MTPDEQKKAEENYLNSIEKISPILNKPQEHYEVSFYLEYSAYCKLTELINEFGDLELYQSPEGALLNVGPHSVSLVITYQQAMLTISQISALTHGAHALIAKILEMLYYYEKFSRHRSDQRLVISPAEVKALMATQNAHKTSSVVNEPKAASSPIASDTKAPAIATTNPQTAVSESNKTISTISIDKSAQPVSTTATASKQQSSTNIVSPVQNELKEVKTKQQNMWARAYGYLLKDKAQQIAQQSESDSSPDHKPS
jgi:hypothetical protein